MEYQNFRQGKSREDFPPNAKAVLKYCDYCGEPFWTNRSSQARYCNLKSTCRVYAFEMRRERTRAKVRARELISILERGA